MKQNTHNQQLLAEGHGLAVLKDTMIAALVVSLTLNLGVLVSFVTTI